MAGHCRKLPTVVISVCGFLKFKQRTTCRVACRRLTAFVDEKLSTACDSAHTRHAPAKPSPRRANICSGGLNHRIHISFQPMVVAIQQFTMNLSVVMCPGGWGIVLQLRVGLMQGGAPTTLCSSTVWRWPVPNEHDSCTFSKRYCCAV